MTPQALQTNLNFTAGPFQFCNALNCGWYSILCLRIWLVARSSSYYIPSGTLLSFSRSYSYQPQQFLRYHIEEFEINIFGNLGCLPFSVWLVLSQLEHRLPLMGISRLLNPSFSTIPESSWNFFMHKCKPTLIAFINCSLCFIPLCALWFHDMIINVVLSHVFKSSETVS